VSLSQGYYLFMQSYEKVLEYLFDKLPMYQNKGADALEYKLDNIRSFCNVLESPQESYPIIHVAGTNGKGSVSHMLSSIFQEAGFKTGLYTSPHLKNFTERIKVNGKEVSQESVVTFVEKYQYLTDQLSPSFFEWTVAMAFHEFKVQEVDIAIVEVGLGGRLDSTNIVNPLLSVITNISKDHMNILGNTLEQIAAEKAGIIKKEIPVIIGERQDLAERVFEKKANLLNAPLYFASDDSFGEYECDLKGMYQSKNCKTALKTIEIFNKYNYNHISNEHIINGLKNVIRNTGLKGRWQVLSNDPVTICDTAHNEAGVKEIVRQLNQISYLHLWMIWGMVEDKEIDTILSLLPKKANYLFCEPSVSRKLTATHLMKRGEKYGLKGEVFPNVNDALKFAREKADKGDVIYVGGSTFVVAEIEDL